MSTLQLRTSSPHPEGLLDRLATVELNSLGRCRPSASRASCPMTLFSRRLRAGPKPDSQTTPGPFLRAAHQRATLPRPGAPCTDRSHRLARRSRFELRCAGRHWCPGFATVDPASDMCSRVSCDPLDPRTYRLFAGALAPHAARRLLQLNRPTSTPTSRPVLALAMASHRASKWPSSHEDRQPSYPRPGATERIRPAPTATTARRSGFTPTCSTRTPLVACSTPVAPGRGCHVATLR